MLPASHAKYCEKMKIVLNDPSHGRGRYAKVPIGVESASQVREVVEILLPAVPRNEEGMKASPPGCSTETRRQYLVGLSWPRLLR